MTVIGRNIPVNLTFTRVIYSLEFAESGLPGGTSWGVSIGGPPTTSTASSIDFNVPNRTYRFVVEPLAGYIGNISGTLTLNGSGRVVPVAFVAVYTVTFHETGLPSGTLWSVSVGTATNISSTPTIGFRTERNVGLYRGTGPRVFRERSRSVHRRGSCGFGDDRLRFGLSRDLPRVRAPKGASWSWSSEPPPMDLQLPPSDSSKRTVPTKLRRGTRGGLCGRSGRASHRRREGPPDHGDLRRGLTVTFSELGLPNGTSWSVSIGGGWPNRSNTSELDFQLSNGSYPYRVTSLPGFRTLWNGNVTVSGAGSRSGSRSS